MNNLNLPFVKIFTDGSYKQKLHRGGWSCLLSCGAHSTVLYDSDYTPGVTVNQMELLAVINGLNALTCKCSVTVFSDSRYVVDGITSWIHNWKRNNWLTKTGEPVKNKELWIMLDELTQRHICTFQWIKSHQSDFRKVNVVGNNVVDFFASNELLD